MEAERLENIVVHGRGRTLPIFALACLQYFLGEKTHVDDTNNAAFFVNHGKSEKFIEDKKLTGVEHGRARRYGHDTPNHDLTQRRLQGGGEKPARGKDSDQTFVRIDREEVNDTFSDAFAPDAIEGFRYREVSVEEGKIFARMFDNS